MNKCKTPAAVEGESSDAREAEEGCDECEMGSMRHDTMMRLSYASLFGFSM